MSASAGISVFAKAANSTMIFSWFSRMNALSEALDLPVSRSEIPAMGKPYQVASWFTRKLR
jgi:hypothetical protein